MASRSIHFPANFEPSVMNCYYYPGAKVNNQDSCRYYLSGRQVMLL